MISKTKSIISLILIGVFMVVFGILSLLPMDLGYYNYPAIVGSLTKDSNSAHTVYAEYRLEALDDAEEDNVIDNESLVAKLDSYVSGMYASASVSDLGNSRIRIETPYDESFSSTLISSLTYKTLDIIPSDLSSTATTDSKYVTYAITAADIESVEMGMTASYAYGVSIKMKEDAVEKLASTTSQYSGGTFYLRLDGSNSVTINQVAEIKDGNFVISSSEYTYYDASNLTANILSAILGAKLTVSSTGTIAPLFGDKISTDLAISALIAILVTIVLFVIKYKLAGLAMGTSTIIMSLLYVFGMVIAFDIPVGSALIVGLSFSLLSGVYLQEICMSNLRTEYEKNPIRSPFAIVKLAFGKGFRSVIDAVIVVVLMAISMGFLGLHEATICASSIAMGVVLSVIAVMLTAGILSLFLGINQKNLQSLGFGKKIEIEEV